MPARTLEYLPVRDLRGHADNPKDHDQALLAESMERFGFTEPPLLDERTGLLIAGHGRLERMADDEAAGREPPEGITVGADGEWLAPVVRGWASTDDHEAHAYLVASNQATIAGGWRQDALTPLLDDLRRNAEQGLAGVGFTSADVDAMLAQALQPPEPDTEPDDDTERPPPQKRAKAGDVWALGAHRLIVGDCRVPAVVDRLMDGAEVNVAVTSPPYADRRKYDETTEFRPIPPEDYVEWFAPVAANVADHLAADGSWFVNIKAGADGLDTHLYVHDLVTTHVREWGWHLLTEFCWERVGVPKQVVLRFKNQWEPVYQFVRDRPKVRPDNVRYQSSDAIVPWGPGRGNTSWADPDSAVVSQGQRGDLFAGQRARRRPSLAGGGEGLSGTGDDVGVAKHDGYAYPGNRLPTFSGTHEATGHTAAYPVGLPAWFVRAYSDPGDTVLDPFAGSGSTLLAAEQEGRVGFGVEVSPKYADVILDRWERHGGSKPKREPRRR